MAGKLTINKISNCTDLKIIMDDATVVGDYSSLEINDVSDSTGTSISMRNMKVMSSDEYQRRKTGESGSRSSGYGGSHSGGQLTVNRIVDSHDTKIDQDNMSISGNFSDIRLNDVERSTKTEISMREFKLNAEDSDSTSDDSDNDDGDSEESDTEFDKDGVPKPSTHAYYMADKFTFSIRLGGGSNVTCTFLQEDRVKTVIKFIKELKPHFQNKTFRLQDIRTERYMDEDLEVPLKDVGFKDNIELQTVITSPSSDAY